MAKDYTVDFYGQYKHKDANCGVMGKTRWRPVENGALAGEATKVGHSPFDREPCPECWE